MTVQEVADAVVKLTSELKFKEAVESLYAHDVVSVEAIAGPGQSRESTGIDAVRGKTDWWVANHEVHSAKVEGPLVAGSHFAVKYTISVTFKPESRKFEMAEIGIYKVADGKIVYEEFFYSM
jgi:hypothetical protein